LEFVEISLAVAGWSLYVVVIAASLVLSLLGLFGAWIILAATIIAWIATGFGYFSVPGLIVLAACATIAEVMETVAAGYGAARYGGGRGSMVAAVVGAISGAILGSPFMLIIGAVAGACIGAFLGATLYEYIVLQRKVGDAAYTGYGAALGKVAGMLAKFLMSLIMVLVIVLEIWFFRG
jgi:uncharacterized protein